MASAAAMASATAASVAATTSAPAAEALSGRTRSRFTHGEFPPHEVLAIEALDGSLGLLRVVHGDEGEAARAAGFSVGDDLELGDVAVLLKGFR